VAAPDPQPSTGEGFGVGSDHGPAPRPSEMSKANVTEHLKMLVNGGLGSTNTVLLIG